MSESSPAFLMLCYGERSRTLAVWRDLRKHYPDAWIIIRFDGDFAEKTLLEPISRDARTRMIEEEALFPVHFGGVICHRMLELFLETDAEVFIKVDPDTQVLRRFEFLPSPEQEYFGGTVIQVHNLQAVQGGCMIFSRATARRILDSELLLSDQLKPPCYAWLDNPECRFRAFVLGLSSTDWCFAWAANQLNIRPQNHDEVLSKWIVHDVSLRDRSGKAVVHPYLPFMGGVSLKNLVQQFKWRRRFQRYRPGEFRSLVALNTSDFDHWNLPPAVMAWLIYALPASGRILELGSGKSSRELSRFFEVVSIEENESFERYLNVEYHIAPFTSGWYERGIVESVLSSRRFDAVIVDGPYAGELGRRSCRRVFCQYVSRLPDDAHIVVDDIERPWDMLTFATLALARRRKVLLFFYKAKACGVILGTRKMSRFDWLMLPFDIARLLLLSVRYLITHRRRLTRELKRVIKEKLRRSRK